MPLEDLTGSDKYLDALNKDWPTDDDERPEGDNHIRGIKNVLLNTFGALAAPFEATRAVLWDVPADQQAQNTGAVPMAGGSTAQRPPNPSLFAWRWNSNQQTGGWIIENWGGSSWQKSLPGLAVQNYYAGDQELRCGDQTELWANVNKFSWVAADGGEEAASLRAKWLTDPAPGPGEAELQLLTHIAGVLETVLAVTATGADFQKVGQVSLDGVPLMSVDPNYDSGQTAFSAGQTIAFTHGLGRKPWMWRVFLECVTGDSTYSPGDRVEFGTVCGTNDTTSNSDTAMSAAYQDNDTEIKVCISSSHIALPQANGDYTKISMVNWALRCVAW